MKERIIIANLIDWSQAFTDPNGSFYCGTTDEHKRNASTVLSLADVVAEHTDLHPDTAPEHRINGGLYPFHNVPHPERYGPDFIYMIGPDGTRMPLGDKTPSPCLTEAIEKNLDGRKTGVIVPRGVYFQGESKTPHFLPRDIEETFGHPIITAEEFLQGDYTRIIAPKQYFDATRIDSDTMLPSGHVDGIPDRNFNIASLLKAKYPADKYELVHVNTGVVEGICRLHTSIGQRQMFPFDRIINISDATTPLYGVGLGYSTAQESHDAAYRVCRDIGIEHMTTQEFLAEFGGK